MEELMMGSESNRLCGYKLLPARSYENPKQIPRIKSKGVEMSRCQNFQRDRSAAVLKMII